MKRLHKYISQVLLLVLLMPLSYQSAHTFLHYIESCHDNHEHTHCAISHDALHHNVLIDDVEEECIVCDYEFTAYDFFEYKISLTSSLIISIIQNQLVVNHKLGFGGNNIELRGPPYLS